MTVDLACQCVECGERLVGEHPPQCPLCGGAMVQESVADAMVMTRDLWGEPGQPPDVPIEDDADANPSSADQLAVSANMTPDQGVLFNLAPLTVVAPDADIAERLDAETLSPAAKKRVFDAATIKQVVLYFPVEAYRTVVERLACVMVATGTKDHTRAVLALLHHWETTRA